jgi:tetrahydromethanopterin S-methyltransferase subunit G
MKKSLRKVTLYSIAKSLDDLAIATHKGFAAVDRRFDKVDEKFEHVDTRLDGIGNRLVVIEGARYHAHETRLENIEDTLRTVRTKLNIK